MIDQSLSHEEVCKLAIRHTLFVTTWSLKHELAAPSFLKAAALFFDGERPVGVAVVTEYYDVQVFVRKSHRRQGIGRALIEEMRRQLGYRAESMDAGKGNEASVKFWKALGIHRWDLDGSLTD